MDPLEVKTLLQRLRQESIVRPLGRSNWVLLSSSVITNNPLVPKDTIYMDYLGVVSKLRRAFRAKMNAILIGPAGVGKTSVVRKMCELEGQPLITTNFSLRTREHHVIGRLDALPDGTLRHKDGPIVICMRNGYTWYADELNTAEPDSLVKLDSPLDFRREIEIEGEIIKAHPDFWSAASVNPMDRYHPGTKELPGQLIRRYPIRIYIPYPPASIEYDIVKLHVPEITKHAEPMMKIIFAVNDLRASRDLPYHPTTSDTIAVAKLVTSGVNFRESLRMTLIDVYSQWGQDPVMQVSELLHSKLGATMIDDPKKDEPNWKVNT